MQDPVNDILDRLGLEKLARAVAQESGKWQAGKRHAGGMVGGFQPFPHQKRAVERAWQNGGKLVMAHGTGTGKTATSIMFSEEALKRSGGPVVVVTPDGLKTQYEQEGVERFTNRNAYVVQTGRDVATLVKLKQSGKVPDYIIIGWSMLRRHAPVLKMVGPTTLVADEAQKMKDPGSENFKAFMELRRGAPHCALLTGSPVSNSPNDLMPLIAAVSDGEVDPRGDLASRATQVIGTFEGVFGKERKQRYVRDPEVIGGAAGKWVDFLSTEDLGNSLPPATTEYIPVEMSASQWREYSKEISGVPPGLMQKVIRGIAPPKKEQSSAFTRVTRARQAAQSTQNVHGLSDAMLRSSPKVEKIADDAVDHLRSDPRNSTVIYSNFINGGVEAMHYALQQRKIPHSIFVGAGREVGDTQIDKKSRDRAISDFKEGKTRILLLSGAGAEGLDLKDANMFQAMEGHFNPEIIRQAQARVRRLKGQQQFKPEERHVNIKRYVSVEPNPGFVRKVLRKITGSPVHYHTTDEWVYNVAKSKHLTNEGVRIALSGAHPMMPGEDPAPERWLLSKPHKYVERVWNIRHNEWRYKYPKEL
jgi:hypothetical protein